MGCQILNCLLNPTTSVLKHKGNSAWLMVNSTSSPVNGCILCMEEIASMEKLKYQLNDHLAAFQEI